MKAIYFAAAIALTFPNIISAQPEGPLKPAKTGKSSSAPKEPLKEGDTVPMFALHQFEGDFVFLKKYCGKNRKDQAAKAVLLNFFATDCTACVAKLERVHELASKYAPGLKTFLISIDPKPEEALPVFVKERNVTLPVLTDMYRRTLSNYGFRTVPQTVLIDGNCKAVYLAKKDDKGFSAITARLETLLK